MWKFLYNNVTRAVDELYYFCEDESDYHKTVEAVHILKRCLNDFEHLVRRINDQKNFEKGHQQTNKHQGGISWEVRKTSIGVRRSQVVTHNPHAVIN
jgi:hypothetical protein